MDIWISWINAVFWDSKQENRTEQTYENHLIQLRDQVRANQKLRDVTVHIIQMPLEWRGVSATSLRSLVLELNEALINSLTQSYFLKLFKCIFPSLLLSSGRLYLGDLCNFFSFHRLKPCLNLILSLSCDKQATSFRVAPKTRNDAKRKLNWYCLK